MRLDRADAERLGLVPKKNPVAVQAGKAAQASGTRLEVMLKHSHRYLQSIGEGKILRHHPETRGAEARFLVGAGEVDYSGFLVRTDGVRRPVAFDAKSVGTDASFTINVTLKKKARVLRRQLDILDDWATLVGDPEAAFFLLWSAELNVGWRLDQRWFPQLWAGERVPISSKKPNGALVHHLPRFAGSAAGDLRLPFIQWWNYEQVSEGL